MKLGILKEVMMFIKIVSFEFNWIYFWTLDFLAQDFFFFGVVFLAF